jgi:hypothetical protein
MSTKAELYRNWYLNNKESIDSLLSKPDVFEYVTKYGIVQSFTTKFLCNKKACEQPCENDSYLDQNEKRIATNPELINFFQSIYHAGTIEQFNEYFICPNQLNKRVDTIFHYLFDLFKKGVYVYIKDNNIRVYLPFSNTNYVNDWGKNLKTYKGDFRTVVQLEEKNHWNPKFVSEEYHTMIQKDPTKWYANNIIFRNTIYKNGELRLKDDEGDKSIANFLFLLTELCYNRIIPDVCFFINPRDFPILKKDRYHPYNRLYPKNQVPYLGKQYPIDNTIPIFSQSITDEYSDSLIPNDDDILGILCDSKKELYNTNWSRKKNIAVFRGSATGYGTKPSNNQRLRLHQLANETKSKLLDVKLISLNEKIKVNEDGYVEIIDKNKYPKMNAAYKEENSLSPKEQAMYKYIIHVQGHVAAFRLTRELSYGSLILKVESEWKTWYSDSLIGWRAGDNSVEGRKLRQMAHYIIIDSDLSNLISTIEWCTENKRNDEICEQIAKRALNFYNDHFANNKYIFDYLQTKLVDYSKYQTLAEPEPEPEQKEMKGIIIVPFRDDSSHKRLEQLKKFKEFFDPLFKYEIVYQEDDKLFNRGLLLNKGFLNNQNYDYFIFHDVDLIPDSDLIKTYYEYPEKPIHIGYKGQRWSTNEKFIGGVLSINKDDFIKVNGFPNDFWGWGGEDDALSNRLRINNISVVRPKHGSVTCLENLTIEEKLNDLKNTGQKNNIKREQVEKDKTDWKNNGIAQLS